MRASFAPHRTTFLLAWPRVSRPNGAMHERWLVPPRHALLALCLGVAGIWTACQRGATVPANEATLQAPGAGAPAAAVTAAAGERPATAGEVELQSEAYVTQPTFVRRAPSEAREVEVAGKAKRQANWMATLQRGEHVRVLEAREGWLRVQSSDEASGWIKRDGVLVGPEVAQATNLVVLQRFTRPDLLALVPTRPIEPGSLLFVLRRKEGFCEVNFAGNAVSWVLADALERDATEVEAAKLLHRARQLAERNDAGAEPLLALARQRFAATRLLAALYPPQAPVPVTPDDVPLGGVTDLGDTPPPAEAKPGALPTLPSPNAPPPAPTEGRDAVAAPSAVP